MGKKKMKWDGSSGNCIDDEYGDRDDDVLSLEAGENYILKLNKFTKHGGILAVANRYLETNKLFQNRSKLMKTQKKRRRKPKNLRNQNRTMMDSLLLPTQV